MTRSRGTTRRKQRILGDLLAIPLGDGTQAFAWVLRAPLVAFFEQFSREEEGIDIEALTMHAILFRVWVMESALRKWPVVGHAPPPPIIQESPWFAKTDPISKLQTIVRDGEERPDLEQAWRTLEPAAVWSAEHIVDRLRDARLGRPNKWLESMRSS